MSNFYIPSTYLFMVFNPSNNPMWLLLSSFYRLGKLMFKEVKKFA